MELVEVFFDLTLIVALFQTAMRLEYAFFLAMFVMVAWRVLKEEKEEERPRDG